MVRNAGEGTGVHEGDTKSGKPRVVDLDDDAAAVLRAYRKDRGSMALQLITPDSLVLATSRAPTATPSTSPGSSSGTLNGAGRRSARMRSRSSGCTILRHTHATLLLAREPVHVVSQRLGHASAEVTMTIYAHVLPGNQRKTTNMFARLIRVARGA